MGVGHWLQVRRDSWRWFTAHTARGLMQMLTGFLLTKTLLKETNHPPLRTMTAKRHHYVPQWCQEPFAAQDEPMKKPMIWVFDKARPDLPPLLQQPLNTGVQGQLYRLKDRDGTDFSLEEVFQELEGHAQPIIKRWRSSNAADPGRDTKPLRIRRIIPCARPSNDQRVQGAIRVRSTQQQVH